MRIRRDVFGSVMIDLHLCFLWRLCCVRVRIVFCLQMCTGAPWKRCGPPLSLGGASKEAIHASLGSLQACGSPLRSNPNPNSRLLVLHLTKEKEALMKQRAAAETSSKAATVQFAVILRISWDAASAVLR